MNKVFLTLISIAFSAVLFSQGPLDISCVSTRNITALNPSVQLPENSRFRIIEWTRPAAGMGGGLQLVIELEGGAKLLIDSRDLKRIRFDSPKNIYDVWKQASLESDLYHNLADKGIQLDVRKELEEESLDFINRYEEYDAFFSDDYLEDYLQTLLYKIHPISLEDGRPGHLSIKIIKSTTPNAFSLPNGMIMISTGLLSLIESEAELISILAHEVSHFVLDHHITNINNEIDRQKRAEFWAGVATLAAAATEAYLATEYDFIPTGDLTFSTAIIASSIAYNAVERLGAKYSREQEYEADRMAGKLLKFIGVDTTAYRSVLVRLKKYAISTGDYGMFLDSESHPNIDSRINAAGGYIDPANFKSLKYSMLVSMATTYSAVQEYNLMHYTSSMKLVDRNIEAGVATEMDYLLKGMLTRSLSDTHESNTEALKYIREAKNLGVMHNDYVYKQEGITLLRLQDHDNAITAFTNYLNALEKIEHKDSYILSEMKWTRIMIYKTNKMKTTI